MMIQPHYPELKLIPFAKTIDNLNENTSLISCFKKTFAQQIEELKSAKKRAPELKKNSYSLPLYHTVLMKIIELIGENACFLKDLKLSEYKKKKLLEHTSELNFYYNKYLVKYKNTPNTLTIRELIENEIYSQIPFLNSYKLLSLTEIEEKKSLADCGYSMIEEINKWLDCSVTGQGSSFPSVVSGQVQDFLKWSKNHQRAASYLISDMALTCSILLDKGVSEKLITSLNARVFTRLFLNALGQCPQYEKVEEKEMLKFRALADLVSYCPMLATSYNIVKKTNRGEYSSFTHWVTDNIQEASINMTSQKITKLIPQGYESIVVIVIKVLQGKEFQDILAEQRYVALFELAGTIKAIVTNPALFLVNVEVCWKTVFESTGLEQKKRIFVQLVIPSAAIYIFTAGLFAALQAPLINAIAGLSAKATISLFLLGISWMFTTWIDATEGAKTKIGILQKITLRERNQELLRVSHFLLTNDRKREEISCQVKKYISDLQTKHALPKTFEILQNVQTTSEENVLIEEIKNEYLLKLKLRMALQTKPLLASDILLIFYEVVNLKKMGAKLTSKNSENHDIIIFSVVENLINGWLQIHLSQAFREKLLSLYFVTEKSFYEESRQKHVEPNDYLTTAINKKINDESRELDVTSNNSLLKTLPVNEILQACFSD